MIRPTHYQTGQQQPIEYMENSFTQEEYDGFCKGNIIKYVSRFRSKNGLEDLKKAQTYLQFLIDTYEKPEIESKIEELQAAAKEANNKLKLKFKPVENPKCGHEWESIGDGTTSCAYCGEPKESTNLPSNPMQIECEHNFKEMETDPDKKICYKCGLKIIIPRR